MKYPLHLLLSLSLSLSSFACGYPTADDPINVELTSSSTGGSSSSAESVLTTTETAGALEGSSSSGGTSSSSSGDTFSSSGDPSSSGESSGSGSSGSTGVPMIPSKCTEGECLIFISSIPILPNQGVDGLHSVCQTLAEEAGHTGSFQALIRTLDGFWEPFQNPGQYVLFSGKLVASGDLGGLSSEPLISPVLENEKGETVSEKSPVWTGFSLKGTWNTCSVDQNLWADGSANTLGKIGRAGSSDHTWVSEDMVPCNSAAHLYCVEVSS